MGKGMLYYLPAAIYFTYLHVGAYRYLEFVERTSNYRTMRRCDDCTSDAIDLSDNPVPFGEYYHLVAHVSIYMYISN